MISKFEDIPRRMFLDSLTLQTLQTYGGFLYENEPLHASDRAYRDPKGVAKLEALRLPSCRSRSARRLSSLIEEQLYRGRAGGATPDTSSGHMMCSRITELRVWRSLESRVPNLTALVAIGSHSYDYLGNGDRALLKDALALECDAFLTMEKQVAEKCRPHQKNPWHPGVVTNRDVGDSSAVGGSIPVDTPANPALDPWPRLDIPSRKIGV